MRARDLADAVAQARSLAQRGDVVLLSPACAARSDLERPGTKSTDTFASADERGDRFVALVREFVQP